MSRNLLILTLFLIAMLGVLAQCAPVQEGDDVMLELAEEGVASNEDPSVVEEDPVDVFEFAQNGVTSNDEWEPVVQEFDGVAMVLVPAGCFSMGASDAEIEYATTLAGDASWYADERPAHEICFDAPFWIDRYEVSNEQFETYSGEADGAGQETDPLLPYDSATWQQAHDFCEQRGVRLPTEAEWEYAARGSDSLIFPWGNTFDGSKLNYEGVDDGYEFAAPVTAFENGASWVGAQQMSGNVWEFVSTAYGNAMGSGQFPYPYQADDGREDLSMQTLRRGIRGGTWAHPDWAHRASNRGWPLPGAMDRDVGIRCGRSFGDE